MTALAARGYWLAFNGVREAVAAVIKGADAAALARDSHRDWYRQLFAPSVEAGADPSRRTRRLQTPCSVLERLAPCAHALGSGPRSHGPYCSSLLSAEDDPAVRTVLGHFLFGFIHPYPDGNGRLARLLMNTMLASGGYPWTVIHVAGREQYMRALESASVDQRIEPFAEFIAAQVQRSLHTEPRR